MPLSIWLIDQRGEESSCSDRHIASYCHRGDAPPHGPFPRASAGAPVIAALLYGLVFVAAVAQTALVPLLPRLAQVDGLSTATTAALIAAPGAATLAVALPAGAFAARFGARRVTLAAGALLAGGMLAQAGGGAARVLAGPPGLRVAHRAPRANARG